MMQTKTRAGFTLLEITTGLIIAAAVAAISIQYLRPAAETSEQRACDMTRQLLQNEANRYMDSLGRLPSADLRELGTTQYAGTVLPTCPMTGDAYTRGRTGIVGCPAHEPTREK